MTSLTKSRLIYKPSLPKILKNPLAIAVKEETSIVSASTKKEKIKQFFPKTFGQRLLKLSLGKKMKSSARRLRVGVIFSGGQAAGGHNVIAGLFDCLMKIHKQSQLIGFKNGPIGIIENDSLVIDKTLVDQYRNQGGFDMIGSGRTKIETKEQFEQALQCVRKQQLDGLVIIGGDDSNTNAAFLAEFFLQNDCPTKVIGIPKTIDGDLQNELLDISFGFDTACKTYSELIGNIARDCLSAKKYYHFIKLMGRSASHIALECAMQTQPNFCIIGEEIAKKNMTLRSIVEDLADLIAKRAENKKNYGVLLIPEGLIEFIPEIKGLISELNTLFAKDASHKIDQIKIFEEKKEILKKSLTTNSWNTFENFPKEIQKQLLLDRDPHGNVRVSQIETEKLLMDLVGEELERRRKKDRYNGKFVPLSHFFGYEGRSAFPSNFDAQYCYGLGYVAAVLIHQNQSGYMALLHPLNKEPIHWEAYGFPLTALMDMEIRKGRESPVIKKKLVDLKSSTFTLFKKKRESWKWEDRFLFPGPIQFFGDKKLTDRCPFLLEGK